MSIAAPLLEVRHLGKRFALPRTRLWGPSDHLLALSEVSFKLEAGKSLGVVGESGSGKSTLARLVMALDVPSAGQVLMNGVDLYALGADDLRRARSGFQMVFQDQCSYGNMIYPQIIQEMELLYLEYKQHIMQQQ